MSVKRKIPFTLCLAENETTVSVNGLRGAPRPPLQSPRPRSEIGASHCVRLRTPACGTAQLDVVSRFASVRHPWRTDLVFPSPAHRFQAGTHRFQRLRFLLLAKRLQRHRWRLNRRSVACRPGQPTGMWAEGAALQGCYLAPDPKAGRHKLREPRSGDSAARAWGCRGRRRLAAPCALLASHFLYG